MSWIKRFKHLFDSARGLKTISENWYSVSEMLQNTDIGLWIIRVTFYDFYIHVHTYNQISIHNMTSQQ